MKPKKLKSLTTLKTLIEAEKRRGKRIVLANGCFDLFHVGHIRYLRESRKQGDVMVVALNSDASVRILKGPGRPLLSQEERALILDSFEFVDYITIFGDRTVAEILRTLRPDVHAKGSDYSLETVPERDIVKRCGGRNIIAGGPKVRSTSEIIKLIAARKDGHE